MSVKPTDPAHVVADEFIESAWGNAVVDMLAWINGRRGVSVLGAPSVAAGTLQTVSWTTLSDSSWGAGPVLVAPADTSGLYIASCNTACAAIIAAAEADLIINVGTASYSNYVPAGKSSVVTTVLVSISPGTQVSVQVYNPNPTAAFFTTSLSVYSVSP